MMKTPIKYVGSKSKFVKEINMYLPKQATLIYEPFSGSAAYSFASGLPFYITDAQEELINFFTILQHKPEELIAELKALQEDHDNDHYMTIRKADRLNNFGGLGLVGRAARYYYTLYAGYNGMYRVNKKNQCNTPSGKRDFVVDAEKLRKASQYMKSYCRGVHLQEFDNQEILRAIIDSGEKPFVLIDPPYVDGDNGAKVFREYTPHVIDNAFYDRIEDFMHDLDNAGIPFLMTNTYCKYITDKFSGLWSVHKVATKYVVGADKTRRGEKHEAFVSNCDIAIIPNQC